MVPSLISRRGRAVMFSAAAGFLLSGPIHTIDENIQEVGLNYIKFNGHYSPEVYLLHFEFVDDVVVIIFARLIFA